MFRVLLLFTGFMSTRRGVRGDLGFLLFDCDCKRDIQPLRLAGADFDVFFHVEREAGNVHSYGIDTGGDSAELVCALCVCSCGCGLAALR